jgi:hypothetical protein
MPLVPWRASCKRFTSCGLTVAEHSRLMIIVPQKALWRRPFRLICALMFYDPASTFKMKPQLPGVDVEGVIPVNLPG